MRFLVYGSLGLAEHVLNAIRETGAGQVVAVVDDQPHIIGKLLSGFQVEPLSRIGQHRFDKIVIATLDHKQAYANLASMGYSKEDIQIDVFWEPFFLQIEPTTRCNFTCHNCTRELLPSERRNRDLTFGDFQKIVDQFSHVKRIQLQGLGEPMLNQDLPAVLKYIKEKGISPSLTTNGSVSVVGGNILAYLDKIIISIDSLNPRRFATLRRGGNLGKVLTNIEDLVRTRANGLPKVVYNCVVSPENFTDIDDIVRFSLDLKPDELHFHFVENWLVPGEDGFSETNRSIEQYVLTENAIANKISAYKEELRSHGVLLTYTGPAKRKLLCWWPFAGTFISVDGHVTPCCIRMNPETINFGNAFSNNFSNMWHGQQYNDFRHSMLFGENSICDCCPR